jgi:hypothetical protein
MTLEIAGFIWLAAMYVGFAASVMLYNDWMA